MEVGQNLEKKKNQIRIRSERVNGYSGQTGLKGWSGVCGFGQMICASERTCLCESVCAAMGTV